MKTIDAKNPVPAAKESALAATDTMAVSREALIKLLTHIENVVDDANWEKIDASLWNAVTRPADALQVAVPQGLIPVAEVKQLCRDYSSRNGSVYLKDVEAQLDALAMLCAAPLTEVEPAQQAGDFARTPWPTEVQVEQVIRLSGKRFKDLSVDATEVANPAPKG